MLALLSDIDECMADAFDESSGEGSGDEVELRATASPCDLDTELCVNRPGSFDCIPITLAIPVVAVRTYCDGSGHQS